jgi:hypothetical protein
VAVDGFPGSSRGRPSGASRPALTGEAPHWVWSLVVFSVAFSLFWIWMFARGGFGVGNGSWGDQLFISYIFGAWIGFTISIPRGRTDVYVDRVRLVNLFRVADIARPAIAAIGVISGIDIWLVNGRRIRPDTYGQGPFKGRKVNRTGRQFGTAMAEILGVATDISVVPTAVTLGPGLVTHTIRRDVPVLMVSCLCLTVLYGVVVRVA